MDNNQLVATIEGKNYVKFTIPVISKDSNETLNEMVKKYNGLTLGVNKVDQGGLWGKTIVFIDILIPEENAMAYSTDNGHSKNEKPESNIIDSLFYSILIICCLILIINSCN